MFGENHMIIILLFMYFIKTIFKTNNNNNNTEGKVVIEKKDQTIHKPHHLQLLSLYIKTRLTTILKR